MNLSSLMSLSRVLILISVPCLAELVLGGPTGLDSPTPIAGKLPKILDFSYYVNKFDKDYSPLETLRKAKLFYGRTLKMFQHNILYSNKSVDYFLSQNQFTDMTPEELKRDSVDNFSDLKMVEEARHNPDLPADRSASVIDLLGEEETESSSSLEDLKNFQASGPKEAAALVDGRKNQEVADLQNMIKLLKDIPELSDKIASVVESPEEERSRIELEKKRIERIRRKNNIAVRQVVEPDNENYDPQLIQSSAIIHGKSRSFGSQFATNLMDGLDFDLIYDFDPYPEQQEPKGGDTQEAKREAGLSLSNLFDTVSYVFEYLTSDDENLPTEEEDGYIKVEPQKPEAAKSVVYDIDWRKTGCISTPRSQASCDSCYAFTVLSLMEYFHCQQTKQLTDFSPQYIVDCGAKADLHGCRGGKISNVGKFIKNHGIELNTLYPYQGSEQTCPYGADVDREKRNGYLRPEVTHWHGIRDMAAWYKWIPRSPLIVGINMPGDFIGYGGGIHDGLDCVPEMTHAMLLVGSGSEDGKKFWLLKNSFGDQWGEAGYFRISKSAPLKCFDTVFVVRVNFKPAKAA